MGADIRYRHGYGQESIPVCLYSFVADVTVSNAKLKSEFLSLWSRDKDNYARNVSTASFGQTVSYPVVEHRASSTVLLVS